MLDEIQNNMLTKAPVTAAERETWQRAIGRLKDPRLYVEAGVEAGVEPGSEADVP